LGEDQAARTNQGEQFAEAGVIPFLLGVEAQQVDRFGQLRSLDVGVSFVNGDQVLDTPLVGVLSGRGRGPSAVRPGAR
jgi:hypothetical protein